MKKIVLAIALISFLIIPFKSKASFLGSLLNIGSSIIGSIGSSLIPQVGSILFPTSPTAPISGGISDIFSESITEVSSIPEISETISGTMDEFFTSPEDFTPGEFIPSDAFFTSEEDFSSAVSSLAQLPSPIKSPVQSAIENGIRTGIDRGIQEITGSFQETPMLSNFAPQGTLPLGTESIINQSLAQPISQGISQLVPTVLPEGTQNILRQMSQATPGQQAQNPPALTTGAQQPCSPQICPPGAVCLPNPLLACDFKELIERIINFLFVELSRFFVFV